MKESGWKVRGDRKTWGFKQKAKQTKKEFFAKIIYNGMT